MFPSPFGIFQDAKLQRPRFCDYSMSSASDVLESEAPSPKKEEIANKLDIHHCHIGNVIIRHQHMHLIHPPEDKSRDKPDDTRPADKPDDEPAEKRARSFKPDDKPTSRKSIQRVNSLVL